MQPMRCNNAGCATPARQMRLYPTDSRLFPTVSQVLPDCTGYTGGVWDRDVTSAMWWSLRQLAEHHIAGLTLPAEKAEDVSPDRR